MINLCAEILSPDGMMSDGGLCNAVADKNAFYYNKNICLDVA